MNRLPTPKRYVTRDLELDLRRNRRITPSSPDPWFGSWDGDAILTREQLAGLKARHLDPETTERVGVTIRTTMAQLWVPLDQKQPWRLIPCPIVQLREDGRVKVIAPNGERKLVYIDGSVRRAVGWRGSPA